MKLLPTITTPLYIVMCTPFHKLNLLPIQIAHSNQNYQWQTSFIDDRSNYSFSFLGCFTAASSTKRAVCITSCCQVHWRVQTRGWFPFRKLEETARAVGEGKDRKETASSCACQQANKNQQWRPHASSQGRPLDKRLRVIFSSTSHIRKVSLAHSVPCYWGSAIPGCTTNVRAWQQESTSQPLRLLTRSSISSSSCVIPRSSNELSCIWRLW